MRTCIYRASNALDAHLVKNVLNQESIEAWIEGEYLQGGVGDLQGLDFIRVVVASQDKLNAEAIVADWDRSSDVEAGIYTPYTSGTNAIGKLIISVFLVAVGAGLLLHLIG